MSVCSAPLQQEMYAGFEDASSEGTPLCSFQGVCLLDSLSHNLCLGLHPQQQTLTAGKLLVLRAVLCCAALCCAMRTSGKLRCSVLCCAAPCRADRTFFNIFCYAGESDEEQDAAAAHGDLQPFTQPLEPFSVSRAGSATRRLRSLFNLRSSSTSSIIEQASSTSGQPPLTHLRCSSTYAVPTGPRDGDGGRDRQPVLGGPGSSLLRAFSTMASRAHSPRKVASSKYDSTVQCSTMKYNAVQCSAVQCTAVQFSTAFC